MSDHAHSAKLYVVIFGLLLVLTAITVAVAQVDLGAANTIVAVVVASVKAALVLLYFMHLRGSEYLTWVFAGAAMIMLAIFFVLTFGDYGTRGWLEIYGP